MKDLFSYLLSQIKAIILSRVPCLSKKSKAFYLFTHHVLDTIYYTKPTSHLNLYTQKMPRIFPPNMASNSATAGGGRKQKL